ncbi:hypothetical protein [Myroides injenensis]|uniref:hypothetical protein n=1 Tax=Myroides injenensis TaxID=1183151 RepID=UPI00226FAF6A|nr:hypothetical protein [Myroides injenensis]
MSKYPLILYILLFTQISFAQEFIEKVTAEELKSDRSAYGKFSSSDAIILNEEEKVYFDFDNINGNYQVVEIVSRKIKILSNSGVLAASFRVPYFRKGVFGEDVKIEHAMIYYLKDNKIVKEKVKSNRIISTNHDDYAEKGVDFIDAPVGSIVEYVYKKVTSYIDILPEWQIEGSLPKLKTTYVVTIPEFYEYKMIKNGIINVKESTKETNTKFYYGSAFSGSQNVNSIQKRFEATNVAPLYEEPIIDNFNNSISKIRFDLAVLKYPFSNPQKVLQDEKEFVQDLITNKTFWKQITNNNFYQKLLPKEEFNTLSEIERIEKVLKFVQNTVKWDGNYSMYYDKGSKSTFNRKLGNSADINLLLINVLKYADLNAQPVFISTRSNGLKNTWQAMFFNHIIAGVKVGDSTYLLDATSPFSQVGVLPFEDLNGVGWMISDKGIVMELDLVPTFASNQSESYQVSLFPKGQLKGYVLSTFDKHAAIPWREKYKEIGEWRLAREIESNIQGVVLSDFSVVNGNDNTNSLRLRYALKQDNAYYTFNNSIIFNPFVFFNSRFSPFVAGERTSDINFGYPLIDNYAISINIPQGYKISSIPMSWNLVDKDLGLQAQLKITQKDTSIECKLQTARVKSIIEAKDYKKVKDFYDKLEKYLEESIIFSIDSK